MGINYIIDYNLAAIPIYFPSSNWIEIVYATLDAIKDSLNMSIASHMLNKGKPGLPIFFDIDVETAIKIMEGK